MATREDERMILRGSQNSEPARKPTPPASASASGPYCQPTNSSMASSSSSSSSPITIPLYHLPSLPMADACKTTLERILKEFQPIIQRRGFRVKSISEFCCCGDGLDETSSRRKRPKQGDSVWGYNQTTTWGSRRGGGGTGGPTKNMSHTIHLRLREPKRHTTQLLTWEFVAGTMAHELSHCVHQNHSPAFYKLMEELLDEHATLQLEQMGNIIYGGSGGTTPATADLPTSGGKRLGGGGGGGGASKSRLLKEPLAGKRLSDAQRPPLTPQARRKAMVQAAERRQRQMARLRHVIERSKEPCVIEILDDDDDDDEEDGHYRNHRRLDQKPAAVVGGATIQEPDLVDLTEGVPRYTKKVKAWNNAVVDLTTSTPSPHTRTTRGSPAASFAVVEGESSTIKEWICDRCTVLNRPVALVCEVCLSERKKESNNDGIIELD